MLCAYCNFTVPDFFVKLNFCVLQPPPDTTMTAMQGNALLAGDVVNISCNAGFMLASSSGPECKKWWQLTCTNSGALEGEGEQCVPLKCGCGSQGGCLVPTSETFSIAPKGAVGHGRIFNVTCTEGYRAVAPDGTWSTCSDPKQFAGSCNDCAPDLPKRCLPVKCVDYSTSDRFVKDWSRAEVTFGQSLIVTCKNGYRAGGACSGVSCPSWAPNSFSVECHSTCQYTAGQTCKPVECGAIPGIANSNSTQPRTQSGLVFESRVAIQCNSGYRSSGAQSSVGTGCSKKLQLQCMSDGQWTLGQCIPVACLPPAGGSEGSTSVVLGSNYSVSCAQGYEMTGPGSTWGVCSETCNFEPALRTCTPKRCDPLKPSDTSSVSSALSQVSYMDHITVTCAAGFVADPQLIFAITPPSCSKNIQLMCQADGTFEFVAPNTSPSLCVPAKCPPLTTVDSNVLPSTTTSSETTFGSSITFQCQDGFTPSGGGSISCGLRDASRDACSWSVGPICEPIVCGEFMSTHLNIFTMLPNRSRIMSFCSVKSNF